MAAWFTPRDGHRLSCASATIRSTDRASPCAELFRLVGAQQSGRRAHTDPHILCGPGGTVRKSGCQPQSKNETALRFLGS